MTYQKDYTTVYTINGHEYEVTAPALFDSKTNELLPDKELDNKAIEMARQLYRKDMGFIIPDNLKQYRAKIGLSQRNLAELTGLSPNTIALYEAGAFPTVANNRLLKSLINNDEVLRQYLTDNYSKYSKELISRLDLYFNKDQSKQFGLIERTPQYSAVQLANWLRVENYFAREADLNIDPITQMKVIKLLYFSYGRYLATTHSKLFSSPIVKMQYGPVITEVHEEFNGQVVLDVDKPDKDAMNDFNIVSQDSEISTLLSRVNEDYIDYTAARLSKQTHQPGSPWSLTKSGKVIKDQLIFDAFRRGVDE